MDPMLNITTNALRNKQFGNTYAVGQMIHCRRLRFTSSKVSVVPVEVPGSRKKCKNVSVSHRQALAVLLPINTSPNLHH